MLVKTNVPDADDFDIASPQDGTIAGATEVNLWLRGDPVGFLDKRDNAFTISRAGNDIRGNADAFRSAYKTLSGDGSLTVKVESIVNTDPWAETGGMIREALESGSAHAMMIVTPGNSCSFQWRLFNPVQPYVPDEPLAKVPGFRQACLEDGPHVDEYEDHGPVRYFRDMFAKSWESVLKVIEQRRAGVHG